MNINSKGSALLHKVEVRFHKQNRLNSKYLIIKRECGSSPLGLFAYYITTLGWIEYAIRNGMIPVVDMKNYYNTFHQKGEVGKINTWELFFEQPCNISLEEALKSNQARYVWGDIPEYQPNESLDFLYNDRIVKYYHQLAKKYIRFQPNVFEILKNKEEKILGRDKGERILGVLARGTDYTSLKPYFHPIQPDIEALSKAIDEYSRRFSCGKIYVATEDMEVLEKLSAIYGERLLYTDQVRVKKVSGYLNHHKEFSERDAFERGIEYLTSIYLLSRCNGLVAGRTSGTVGACLLAEDYEFKHVFSLGRYGIEDIMLQH
ncbi:MAG: hypothetical protein IJP31_10650 [Lachnospiraceae bacterium]|nr:hypothetical protein [Lachnospiraceae bacterium]